MLPHFEIQHSSLICIIGRNMYRYRNKNFVACGICVYTCMFISIYIYTCYCDCLIAAEPLLLGLHDGFVRQQLKMLQAGQQKLTTTASCGVHGAVAPNTSWLDCI